MSYPLLTLHALQESYFTYNKAGRVVPSAAWHSSGGPRGQESRRVCLKCVMLPQIPTTYLLHEQTDPSQALGRPCHVRTTLIVGHRGAVTQSSRSPSHRIFEQTLNHELIVTEANSKRYRYYSCTQIQRGSVQFQVLLTNKNQRGTGTTLFNFR